MSNEVYRTYKYYDERGRRLAIFGRHIEKDLMIYVYACSKEDNFSKKFIKEEHEKSVLGEETKTHPVVSIISIIENKPLYSFIKFCNENYLKKVELTVVGTQEILIKPIVNPIIKKYFTPVKWVNKTFV